MSEVDEGKFRIISATIADLAFLLPLKPITVPGPQAQERAWRLEFSGHGRGGITVLFSSGLAETVAANMYGMTGMTDIRPDHVDEAARELANCLAGNLLPQFFGTAAEFNLSTALPVTPPIQRSHFLAIACAEGVIAVGVESGQIAPHHPS